MSLVIRSSSEQDAEATGALAAEFQEYMRSLGDPTEFTASLSKILKQVSKCCTQQMPQHFLSFEVCNYRRCTASR